MIKQIFDVEDYWKIIVYYDFDYRYFEDIASKMRIAGASLETIEELKEVLSRKTAKAFTYSNIDRHVSIIVFNEHKTKEDYINSIVHEAEHVKQAMLQAYLVEDEGEAPAYTVGYLVSCMYRVFKKIICEYRHP